MLPDLLEPDGVLLDLVLLFGEAALGVLLPLGDELLEAGGNTRGGGGSRSGGGSDIKTGDGLVEAFDRVLEVVLAEDQGVVEVDVVLLLLGGVGRVLLEAGGVLEGEEGIGLGGGWLMDLSRRRTRRGCRP